MMAVVIAARIRCDTRPELARSVVTSMPVSTAYAGRSCSSRTMLLLHRMRSFLPSLVVASPSRTTG